MTNCFRWNGCIVVKIKKKHRDFHAGSGRKTQRWNLQQKDVSDLLPYSIPFTLTIAPLSYRLSKFLSHRRSRIALQKPHTSSGNSRPCSSVSRAATTSCKRFSFALGVWPGGRVMFKRLTASNIMFYPVETLMSSSNSQIRH